MNAETALALEECLEEIDKRVDQFTDDEECAAFLRLLIEAIETELDKIQ